MTDRDADGDPEGAARAEDDPPAVDQDAVDEKYDFEDFGPRDMDEMSLEEWEAAFDPDTWITGAELLDRVEADLQARVANRDVFAVVEREEAGDGERLLAYSDEGYAVVTPDGSVEGRGTVLRDVKASVALASMDDYEVPEPPADAALPDPADVSAGSGELGHRLLSVVAGIQVLAGAVLLLASVLYDPLVRAVCSPVPGTAAYACAGVQLRLLGGSAVVAAVAGVGFLLFGAVMFALVANARLSDRFRAAEFRDRLRNAGVDTGERPSFVPDAEEREE